MTAFFLSPSESPGEDTEAAYRQLRERSQTIAGCAAASTRIFKLSCRIDGHDRELQVGRPVCDGGDLVVAIFDHGRDEAFAVHTAAASGGPGVIVRVNRPVYSVTEFS